jgi:uroporphyrinogen-III synthase
VTQTLAGLVVVVTRPAHQASRFIGLLKGRGAEPVPFPTIAIEPVPLDGRTRAALVGESVDWVVYTSGNAVEQGLSQLGRPRTAKVAAIGRATARALETAGVHVDALPATGADSEGLLALPQFGDPAGKRVLVVKGVGGRDALRTGLEARGATVTLAEVYRRVPVRPAAGAVDALRRGCETETTVIAVTSVEVLESLLELAMQSRITRLGDACLLVPGERVATAARRLGWRGSIVAAQSAEDEAMLDALLRHRGGSGPPVPA